MSGGLRAAYAELHEQAEAFAEQLADADEAGLVRLRRQVAALTAERNELASTIRSRAREHQETLDAMHAAHESERTILHRALGREKAPPTVDENSRRG